MPIIVFVTLYAISYGVLRWRNCIVMHEYYLTKSVGYNVPGEPLIRYLGPGHDLRDNRRGQFKNAISPILFSCMHPCAWLEVHLRGLHSPEKYRDLAGENTFSR